MEHFSLKSILCDALISVIFFCLVLALLDHMNSMLYNHVCHCLDVLRVYADGKAACLACSMDVRLDLHLVNLTFFTFF